MKIFFLFKFELNPKYTKCNRIICWTLLKEKLLFKFHYLKKCEVYICVFVFSFCFVFSVEKDINVGKGSFCRSPASYCSHNSTLLLCPCSFKFRFYPRVNLHFSSKKEITSSRSVAEPGM